MRSIFFNSKIWYQLRPNYYVGFVALPVGIMLAALVFFSFVAEELAEVLGIPPGVPVIEQPNGILWLVISLIVGVTLMITGCWIGYLLNALILRFVFGWSWMQLRELFLFSQVPPHWRKGESKQ